MGNKERCAKMHERSGDIHSDDPIVGFLYILMRDYIPTGTIENIMIDHVEGKSKDCVYTNGWLAQYAMDVAKRLAD